MFTGLIERVGEIVERKPMAGGMRYRIASSLASELAPGDSLAVNGVCLTVISAVDGQVHADVGPETLRVTTLGALDRGAVVNLERPLRADGRLGGHFVQGHVDGNGNVEEIRPDAEFHWITISYPPALAPYLVLKGSIAVDGISLTIAGLGNDRFDVMIIPYTFENTNLRTLKIRDRVNLECDMVGKYVIRATELAGLTLTTAKGVH
ncbi:MAG TPA: riboflavin synthase [Vicinamibacterales bacterium]|nr:riboflavin synthase [Vicinamibacterales bacterium]